MEHQRRSEFNKQGADVEQPSRPPELSTKREPPRLPGPSALGTEEIKERQHHANTQGKSGDINHPIKEGLDHVRWAVALLSCVLQRDFGAPRRAVDEVLIQPSARRPTPAQPAVRIAQAQYSQAIYGSSKEHWEKSKEILKNGLAREQAGIERCARRVAWTFQSTGQ